MLIQFNFKNFKSFRNEVSLDLSATKITEHGDHVVEMANDRLLKVAVIYGANASGKSNIYDAFKFMSCYVKNSFQFGGESGSRYQLKSENNQASPFLFDSKSREEESTFEVFFVDQSENTGRIYQYGFALQNEEVVEEWLFSKAKTARNRYNTIFYRKKGEELAVNGLPKSSIENIKVALEKETLIVSLGAKLKITRLKKVREWFLNNEIADFGNPTENFFCSNVLPKGFIDSKQVQDQVVDYFASFDHAICDFRVEKVQKETEKGSDHIYKIDALHKMADCDEFGFIPLKSESSGTLKMFALYPSLKGVFDNGGVLFVDELNARLHPLLVRNIILSFFSPEINRNHAQLIFTTHDVWQLSNELLRRDEIWLTEKDEGGCSDLYSLAEFKDEDGNKVRRDEALAKNYLTGSYGAIPALKPMEMLKGGRFDDDE